MHFPYSLYTYSIYSLFTLKDLLKTVFRLGLLAATQLIPKIVLEIYVEGPNIPYFTFKPILDLKPRILIYNFKWFHYFIICCRNMIIGNWLFKVCVCVDWKTTCTNGNFPSSICIPGMRVSLPGLVKSAFNL